MWDAYPFYKGCLAENAVGDLRGFKKNILVNKKSIMVVPRRALFRMNFSKVVRSRSLLGHCSENASLVSLRNKVNRCLARYSPRATTTDQPTNRALNKPAWPGPYQPKMPILGQIWSFLGKKSFFLLEKS